MTTVKRLHAGAAPCAAYASSPAGMTQTPLSWSACPSKLVSLLESLFEWKQKQYPEREASVGLAAPHRCRGGARCKCRRSCSRHNRQRHQVSSCGGLWPKPCPQSSACHRAAGSLRHACESLRGSPPCCSEATLCATRYRGVLVLLVRSMSESRDGLNLCDVASFRLGARDLGRATLAVGLQ